MASRTTSDRDNRFCLASAFSARSVLGPRRTVNAIRSPRNTFKYYIVRGVDQAAPRLCTALSSQPPLERVHDELEHVVFGECGRRCVRLDGTLFVETTGAA